MEAPAILDKDELRGLDAAFVKRVIHRVLAKDQVLAHKIKLEDKKAVIQLKKLVRAQLRDAYGMFLKEKRKKITDAYKEEKWDKLLSLHQSTVERAPFYDRFYQEIFTITGVPNSVLDLGCGFNPFSMSHMKTEPQYYACDINEQDIKIIAGFLKKQNCLGKAWVQDLTQPLPDLPHVNVCLLLKILDVLEVQERYLTERLLNSINADWIVVSFATKSMGGRKRIDDNKRNWFNKVLDKNLWSYSTFSIPNEIVYLVNKV